jgi:hypothetical protein
MGYSIDNVIFEYNRQAFKGTRSYTEEAQSYTGKFLTWPRPLRYQGRFATKAASLPRPLRYQGRFAYRTKLKLTMKTMKGMKFFSSFFMLFMSFMVEHFLVQNARRCLSRY